MTANRVSASRIGLRFAAGGLLLTGALVSPLSAQGAALPPFLELRVPKPPTAKLAGGTRAVVYFWVPVEANSIPSSLRHRVTLEVGSGDSVRTQDLEGALIPVSRPRFPP